LLPLLLGQLAAPIANLWRTRRPCLPVAEEHVLEVARDEVEIGADVNQSP
jgi:hypothetical protein